MANLTHAQIIVHQKNEEIPSQVAEGKADVMITEITEAPWYVQNDPRLAAPLLNSPFTHGEIGVLMRKGQLMFDGDEGHHWVPGIGVPMIIDSVKTELLTGDQAQAEVWLRDKRGSKGYLEMNLYLENGAWKVHNWIDDDVYPFGSLWHWMQNFLDGDMDAEEHEEPDLNQYAE